MERVAVDASSMAQVAFLVSICSCKPTAKAIFRSQAGLVGDLFASC